MLTRTAISLLSAAALAGAAESQQPTIRPWPGSANSYQPQAGFATFPQNSGPSGTADQTSSAANSGMVGGVPWSLKSPTASSNPDLTAAAWTTTGSAGASTQPIHTLYYRKETETPKRSGSQLVPARPAPSSGIRLAQAQQPVQEQAPPPRLEESYRPPREKLFLLDSEAGFVQRENAIRRSEDMRLPRDQQRAAVIFPTHEAMANQPYQGRCFPAAHELIEPSYVLYGRLFFEDKNSERYGWEMGALQPFVTAGKFVWDASILPYKMFSYPRLSFDSNAGLCLPGDPVPMLLYPPEISLTGLTAETIYIASLVAIIH